MSVQLLCFSLLLFLFLVLGFYLGTVLFSYLIPLDLALKNTNTSLWPPTKASFIPIGSRQTPSTGGISHKKTLKTFHTLAFLKQLTPQTIEFANPAVFVLLRNYLQQNKCQL